jgi:hypothetical protein
MPGAHGLALGFTDESQASVTHEPLRQVWPVEHDAVAHGSATHMPWIEQTWPDGQGCEHGCAQVPGELPSV